MSASQGAIKKSKQTPTQGNASTSNSNTGDGSRDYAQNGGSGRSNNEKYNERKQREADVPHRIALEDIKNIPVRKIVLIKKGPRLNRREFNVPTYRSNHQDDSLYAFPPPNPANNVKKPTYKDIEEECCALLEKFEIEKAQISSQQYEFKKYEEFQLGDLQGAKKKERSGLPQELWKAQKPKKLEDAGEQLGARKLQLLKTLKDTDKFLGPKETELPDELQSIWKPKGKTQGKPNEEMGALSLAYQAMVLKKSKEFQVAHKPAEFRKRMGFPMSNEIRANQELQEFEAVTTRRGFREAQEFQGANRQHQEFQGANRQHQEFKNPKNVDEFEVGAVDSAHYLDDDPEVEFTTSKRGRLSKQDVLNLMQDVKRQANVFMAPSRRTAFIAPPFTKESDLHGNSFMLYVLKIRGKQTVRVRYYRHVSVEIANGRLRVVQVNGPRHSGHHDEYRLDQPSTSGMNDRR